jgi:DNA-binding IclR family transcriptional regulator
VAKHVFDNAEQLSGDRPPAVLARAIRVLEDFAHQDECGVRELARSLEVSPSTAYHLLAGLERLGLLQRTADRRYRLGWRAAALGSALSKGFRPAELAEEVLAELARETGETAHLGILQGTEVVYLAKVEGHHAVRLASQVGQRFPAHATACGKALLAFDDTAAEAVVARGLPALTAHTLTDESALRAELADVRAGALARDSEEIELHAACAAVPVLPHGAEPVRFALSVSGARPRIEESLPMLEAALRRAAGALARRLYGDDDENQIRPAAA